MRTTVNISDTTIHALRREALRRGQSISRLVETALQAILKPPTRATRLPRLPEFTTGGARVDIANRELLYDVMDQ